MKKILIGRGAGNDIRLKDESDRVSRRQAVIEVSLTGKMILHDTSSNGTFVNDKPVKKPGGCEVKRGDKVDFAHVMELDWTLIKDPYKGMKIALGIFAAVLLILAVLFFTYSDELLRKSEPAEPTTEMVDTVVSDSESVEAEEGNQVTTSSKSKKSSVQKQDVKVNPKDNPGQKSEGDEVSDGNKVSGEPNVSGTEKDKTGNSSKLVPDNGPKIGGSMKNEKY